MNDLFDKNEMGISSRFAKGNRILCDNPPDFYAFLVDVSSQGTCFEEETLVRSFILDHRHNQHENMAGWFQRQFNNNPGNLPSLVSCLLDPPEYLHPDNYEYTYIRKLIYAIGAQPTPNSMDALLYLDKNSPSIFRGDSQFVDLVKYHIEKRNKMGRFEYNKCCKEAVIADEILYYQRTDFSSEPDFVPPKRFAE